MSKIQPYPRIEENGHKYQGFLDDGKVAAHIKKIDAAKVREIMNTAIGLASRKSSRAIIDIADEVGQEEVNAILLKKGDELFKYFVDYCSDPASSAAACLGRNFVDVAKEQFYSRSLQKERMNTAWRYQFIARDLALESERFISVSDVGTADADFNSVIKLIDPEKPDLSIYVSMKNRSTTISGGSWPKAIQALEEYAIGDRNRVGPYICVFGMAIENGIRFRKVNSKTKTAYSPNSEVWQSDFFWPFFTNFSYLEIVQALVSVLQAGEQKDVVNADAIEIPEALINSFGEECKKFKLLDGDGNFNDASKLARLFVMRIGAFRKSEAPKS